MAALVATRRPRNPIGWMLAATCAALHHDPRRGVGGLGPGGRRRRLRVGGALDQYAIALGFPLVPLDRPAAVPHGPPSTPRWRWRGRRRCRPASGVVPRRHVLSRGLRRVPGRESTRSACGVGRPVDVLADVALVGVLDAGGAHGGREPRGALPPLAGRGAAAAEVARLRRGRARVRGRHRARRTTRPGCRRPWATCSGPRSPSPASSASRRRSPSPCCATASTRSTS